MMHLPSFTLNHTTLIQSNSYLKAPLSDDHNRYPLVIISHGWTGFRNIHTDIAEMLASNGYIVVSVDHTYGSSAVVFEDEVAFLNPNALLNREDEAFIQSAETLVNTYSDDIILVLDHLQQLDELDHFKDKIDLSNIGLLGHSTGGGASVRTSLIDSRITAVMGLDPWVEPVNATLLNQGLQIPSLFLRSDDWETRDLNNTDLLQLLDSSNDTYLFQINGTMHSDFTMAYMYSPLTTTLGITGELDWRTSVQIQHDFILSFFNHELKHQNDELNQIQATYEEIENVYK